MNELVSGMAALQFVGGRIRAGSSFKWLLWFDLFDVRCFNIPLNIRVPPRILVPRLKTTEKKTPWSESTSELYRPSDRRLSAK
jgi:hypothetical protein